MAVLVLLAAAARAVMDASVNEHFANDNVVAHVKEAIGETPRAIRYAKGFSIESFFEHNTREGIATVAPFAAAATATALTTTPSATTGTACRCKHCGGEGRFVSFLVSPKPRLIYTCGLRCAASTRADGTPIRMSIDCDEKLRFPAAALAHLRGVFGAQARRQGIRGRPPLLARPLQGRWFGLDKESAGQVLTKIEDDEDVGMPPPHDDGEPPTLNLERPQRRRPRQAGDNADQADLQLILGTRA